MVKHNFHWKCFRWKFLAFRTTSFVYSYWFYKNWNQKIESIESANNKPAPATKNICTDWIFCIYCIYMFNKFKFNFCSRQTSRRKRGSRMLEVRSWYSGWMGHLLFQGISYVVVVIFLLLLMLLSWYNGWMSHRLLLLISWKGSWRFWVQECGRQRTNWATGVPRARILYQGQKLSIIVAHKFRQYTNISAVLTWI